MRGLQIGWTSERGEDCAGVSTRAEEKERVRVARPTSAQLKVGRQASSVETHSSRRSARPGMESVTVEAHPQLSKIIGKFLHSLHF